MWNMKCYLVTSDDQLKNSNSNKFYLCSGLANKEIMMKPEMSILGDQVVIQAGGTFDITCR